MKKIVLLLAVGISLVAYAADRVTADQGAPGKQGPWPVTLSGGSGSNDGGFAFQTAPVECRGTTFDGGNPDTLTLLGAGSTPVPASAAVNRVYVNVCVSPNNVSTAVVKCLTGGVAPVLNSGPGQVLLYGDCVQYTAIQTNTIDCVSDGGYAVTAFECVPQ